MCEAEDIKLFISFDLTPPLLGICPKDNLQMIDTRLCGNMNCS